MAQVIGAGMVTPVGGDAVMTAAAVAAKVKGDGGKLGDNLGNKPNASCVDELSSTAYPSQAHHLIPNARLNPAATGAKKDPPHPVHELLIKGDYLYADTDYDINHKNNGKWMPYAHALNEWIAKATKKNDIAHNKALMFMPLHLTQHDFIGA